MKRYESKEFVEALTSRISKEGVPNCRYCGGQKFTTTDKYATILIGDDLNSVSIGPSVPSGMIVCEQCGHIDFFALGALGLLHGKEADNNGK